MYFNKNFYNFFIIIQVYHLHGGLVISTRASVSFILRKVLLQNISMSLRWPL